MTARYAPARLPLRPLARIFAGDRYLSGDLDPVTLGSLMGVRDGGVSTVCTDNDIAAFMRTTQRSVQRYWRHGIPLHVAEAVCAEHDRHPAEVWGDEYHAVLESTDWTGRWTQEMAALINGERTDDRTADPVPAR